MWGVLEGYEVRTWHMRQQLCLEILPSFAVVSDSLRDLQVRLKISLQLALPACCRSHEAEAQRLR